jgi:hypothetical protein
MIYHGRVNYHGHDNTNRVAEQPDDALCVYRPHTLEPGNTTLRPFNRRADEHSCLRVFLNISHVADSLELNDLRWSLANFGFDRMRPLRLCRKQHGLGPAKAVKASACSVPAQRRHLPARQLGSDTLAPQSDFAMHSSLKVQTSNCRSILRFSCDWMPMTPR